MLLPPADPAGYRVYTGGTDQPQRRIFTQTIRGVPAHGVRHLHPHTKPKHFPLEVSCKERLTTQPHDKDN